jgi:hypothetical protein
MCRIMPPQRKSTPFQTNALTGMSDLVILHRLNLLLLQNLLLLYLWDVSHLQVWWMSRAMARCRKLGLLQATGSQQQLGTTGQSSIRVVLHTNTSMKCRLSSFQARDHVMELTSHHQVSLYTEACGSRYCVAAKLIKATQVQPGGEVYMSQMASNTSVICHRYCSQSCSCH